MKPITEEKRQQLITFARIEISRWKLPADKQYMVDLMEIALASLTATEVGYVAVGETSTPPVEYCAPVVAGDFLYADPPVSVIKFPNPHGIPDGYDLESCMATARWYHNEIKRLNGLS